MELAYDEHKSFEPLPEEEFGLEVVELLNGTNVTKIQVA